MLLLILPLLVGSVVVCLLAAGWASVRLIRFKDWRIGVLLLLVAEFMALQSGLLLSDLDIEFPLFAGVFQSHALSSAISFLGVLWLAQFLLERRQVMQKLLEREQYLRAIFDTEPECVKCLAPDGRLLEMNAAGLAMIEAASLAEARERPLVELVAPQFRAEFTSFHQRVMAGERSTLEFEIQGLKGARRWLNSHAVPLRDAKNNVTTLLAITRDVTDRRWVEQALRASESRYRRLVESNIVGVIVADVHGHIKEANDAFLAMVGYTRQDLAAGLRWDTITPADWQHMDEHIYNELMRSGICLPVEKEYFHKDGSRVAIRAAVARLEGADGDCICLIENITERKTAEKLLVQSELRLRRILDNLLAFVGVLSTDGIVLEANRLPLELARLQREDAIGRPFVELPPFSYSLEVQQRLRSVLARVAKGEVVRYEEVLLMGERLIPVDACFAPVRNAEGKIVEIVGSGVDITEQKRIEIDLRESRQQIQSAHSRLQALSRQIIETQEAERQQIARELHDEFGQLLATLGLHLHAARSAAGPELMPRFDECFHLLQQASEQVRNLAQGLRPPMLELLGLEPAIHWLVERYQRGAECHIELSTLFEQSKLTPEMSIACFRVVQEALTNVTRHSEAQHCRVEIRQSDQELELLVHDDGVGFDVAKTLSEAAEKRKFGLIGMHERIALLSGHIEIKSAPRLGTSVHVRFPLTRSCELTAASGAPAID